MRKLIAVCSFLICSELCFCQVKTLPAETRMVAEAQKLFDAGEDVFKSGNAEIANFYYGQAVTLLESFDKAVNVINYIKNVNPLDDAPEDSAEVIAMMKKMGMSEAQLAAIADQLENVYDEDAQKFDDIYHEYYKILACQSMVSPYPDYFMGLVEDFKGNGQKAREYYLRAAANPYMISDLPDFSFIEQLTGAEIKELSTRLKEKILAFGYNFTQKNSQFVDTPDRWNPQWHLTQANSYIQENNKSYPIAMQFCDNAIKVFPFQVEYYILGADLAILAQNSTMLVRFINGGLELDPDNATLRQMADELNLLIESTK